MARKGIYLINLPPITSRRINSSSYSIPPGTSGYVLQTDPSSTNGFSWVMTSSGGGGSPTGLAGGDLTGSYPNPVLKDILTGLGPIGSATTVPVITIDNKGRATALSSATIAITTASVSGLGTAAGKDTSYFATAAQGTLADGALQKANNLSDLVTVSTARTNLGLGTVATLASDTDGKIGRVHV